MSEEIAMPLTSSNSDHRGGDRAPLRILFIIDHLLAVGGGESALVKAVRLLPPDRFRCFVMTLRGKISHDIVPHLPCRTFEVDLRCSYDARALKAACLVRKVIRTEKIDIVHTFFETSNLWGGLVAKCSGAPLLVSSRRDMGILRSFKHILGYRLVNQLCDGVVAVSEEVRQNCIATEHIDPAKLTTVYNGVDIEVKHDSECPLLDTLDLPRLDQVVITIANIRRVKGIDVLIRAAALVRDQFPDVTFVIVGRGNEPETVAALRDLVRELALERNVRFLGYQLDTAQLLRRSKVFCMLSRSEGFSNTVLEAMASSLPCIVTRVGGNPEAVVDGITGFLVDPEDHESAAMRICHLLRNPEKAMAMGRAGRERVVRHFSSNRMIRDLVTFYEHLAFKAGRSTTLPVTSI
ncbi:glycosyltransferase [Acidobacteria bacterium AB60]|nr:glycosyltransferase [Acidobacteria bacterium AB60]